MEVNTGIYVALIALFALLVMQRLRNRKAPATLVAEKIRSGARIIDVRSPAEYASGSYPKAKNIPLDRLEARIGELPKDKSIVLFCASGARSGRAARLLKRSGFSDVLSAGGLADMPR
jgi:phage shock protein E